MLGVAGRHQGLGAVVAGLRLREFTLLELGIRDHRPGDALLGRIDGRAPRQEQLRGGHGARIVLGGIQVGGRAREHLRALGMPRERLRELERAVDLARVHLGLRIPRQRLLLLGIRDDRRIAGIRRPAVNAVSVGRMLVFLAGFHILPAFEQRLGEQEVRRGAPRVVRKRPDEAAVPLGGLFVVGRTLGPLRLRVVVLRHVLQVRFELGEDLRFVLRLAIPPVGGPEAVVLDELLLPLKDEIGKAALRVRFDGQHLQLRRLFVVAVLRHERTVGVGGVGVALLFDVQVAEPSVEQVRIRSSAAVLHEIIDGFRPVQVRERDGHDAEGVLDQFAIRPAQGLDLDQSRRVALGHQHRIEHARKGIQARLVFALLEQRPSVLVEALVVEGRLGTDLDHGLVGRLALPVRLLREQQLASPELHLVDVSAAWIARDQLIQRGQRLVGLGIEFVGPRQLVEHGIVALVLRVRREQRRIEMDGLGGPQPLVRDEFALDALGFGALQIQIAEPAQRLGPQRRIARVQVEESAVAVHGLAGVHPARGRRIDLDLLRFEILDGRRARRRRRGRRRTRHHGAPNRE